ncbi:histidine kinase, partial [Streptomyces sp. NPDC054961]
MTESSSLPVLLEAVLNVGSELELRATLQHIVESATELCAARYGARGGKDPPRARRSLRFTARLDQGAGGGVPPLAGGP